MNITEFFFKDVFEYEYGYIDENHINDELFKLNTKSQDFWEKVEEFLSSKSDIHLFYISAKYILKDNILSEDEYVFMKKLLQIMKIIPSDIYLKYKSEIDRLVYEQYYLLYLDDKLDNLEEQEMRNFSQIFGAEYVTMCEIKRKVLSDKYEKLKADEIAKSRYISESTLIEVFERDKGRCVLCGSTDDIEYDHIIPFSKGGSNDAQNIRVLCRKCNRKKSNNIGLIE
ncbi:MAG: hypothetical protein COZ21_15075 [Bacteroidetes bacterium CG_4_10_14_3_um_filter_31_20]|nr:MAG: hypothetical protein COZ21_15075 [Bacteroidetes bacterium CG_4_10_14_3_um_filter_31_20]